MGSIYGDFFNYTNYYWYPLMIKISTPTSTKFYFLLFPFIFLHKDEESDNRRPSFLEELKKGRRVIGEGVRKVYVFVCEVESAEEGTSIHRNRKVYCNLLYSRCSKTFHFTLFIDYIKKWTRHEVFIPLQKFYHLSISKFLYPITFFQVTNQL